MHSRHMIRACEVQLSDKKLPMLNLQEQLMPRSDVGAATNMRMHWPTQHDNYQDSCIDSVDKSWWPVSG